MIRQTHGRAVLSNINLSKLSNFLYAKFVENSTSSEFSKLLTLKQVQLEDKEIVLIEQMTFFAF